VKNAAVCKKMRGRLDRGYVGTSVNPGRSLGPAPIVGGKALSQVWLFLVVPAVAGFIGGLFFRTKLLSADK
jgi:aquaporin Z